MKSLSCFCTFVFICGMANMLASQELKPPQLTDGSNFFTIQKDLNDFYEKNPQAKGYKQWKRKEWFLEPRMYPSGKMENLTLKTWHAYQDYLKENSVDRSTHGSWAFLGPSSCSIGLGRLNAIALHPTDADIIYVGSSNGGVWKTVNGGTSWSNVSPDIPLLAIADIKLNPADPDIVYILTGDGDPDPDESYAYGQAEVSSIGILRSLNGGASWGPLNFSFENPTSIVPTKLLIHPTNINIQFVVGNHGIYRTSNHWATWDTVRPWVTYDIEFKPGNPNIMYGGGESEIIKSTDGGVTWNNVTDADFDLFLATRVEIAIAPNNSNVVYALAGNWFDGLIGFYQSESEGSSNTWTEQNASTTVMGKYAKYCNGLVVDPADYTDVFAGFQHIAKSTNEGSTWTSIDEDPVHADIHDIAYMHGALWLCTDGGLYKSINEGSSWTDLSQGMAITEVYKIAGTPQSASVMYLGCQDNGTMRRPSATTTFDHVLGADGMSCVIDFSNINIVYASQQYGNFHKSIDGGDSFIELNVPGTGAWVSPLVMDQNNHNRLFAGKASVFRSNNAGTSWTDLNVPLAIDEVNCMASAASDANILYVANEATMYRCNNALALSSFDWDPISTNLPDLFITGIAVDPNHENVVFVTFSGYEDGQKVYRSTNSGGSWSNISGSLPNVPVNCIVYHDNGLNNNALYIGTDIGVFYRDDDLNNWIFYSNSMPSVMVTDLYINTNNNSLVAGTYGRGLWRSNLYDGCITDIPISNSGVAVGGVKYFSASGTINSNAIYKKELGTEIHYKAGNSITLTTEFTAGGNGFFHGYLGSCPGGPDVPFMSPFISTSRLLMDGFNVEKEKTGMD